MAGNLSGDPKAAPRVYASASNEGFLMFDMDGKILKHVRVGHNQSPSVGKYRTDLPGLQYVSVNYWKNPGIVTLFDANGEILAQDEPIHSGSPMLPVNWRGDGQEYVLLSGNIHLSGLIDGHLRRAVMFPDDGHPELAATVMDLTGDQRDEIVLWDQGRVWIYTQDRQFKGDRIYAPLGNPDYNDPTTEPTCVPYPNWEKVRVKH
jgi:rhamnogalacturonan endolyase